MNEPLAIYLNDHLSASKAAVDFLKMLRDHHTSDTLGPFASALLSEIEEEQRILVELRSRIGCGSTGIKEGASWVAAKAGRLKLRNATEVFGVFETLEMLMLGLSGKKALWQALQLTAVTDVRLREIDYAGLIERSEGQRARVDRKRLEVAAIALTGIP